MATFLGYAFVVSIALVINGIILFVASKITAADLSPKLLCLITVATCVPQIFLDPLPGIAAKFGLLFLIMSCAGDTDSIVDIILLLVVYTILNVLVTLTILVKMMTFIAEHPEKFPQIPGMSAASSSSVSDSNDDDDDESSATSDEEEDSDESDDSDEEAEAEDDEEEEDEAALDRFKPELLRASLDVRAEDYS